MSLNGTYRTTTTTMAEDVAMAKHISASKLVQEIAKKGDQVPEEYLLKDGFHAAIDAFDLWKNDLLIDCSLLNSSTSELAKLRSALSQWGCFQVVNHGIESSFLDKLIEVVMRYFVLPLEEKLKCYAEDDMFQGYGSDALNSGLIQRPNWNDMLILTLNPREEIKQQSWPQKPENFRVMINEYSDKLTEVNKVICKAMARSLNLHGNSLNFGKQGPAKARFTLYPRCPCPEQVLGINPHSDSSAVTYLLPEKVVEGLQILKDGQWYKVSVIPGALVMNIGDLGEVITNGVFKSAVHRVGTNSMMDRVSVGMFFNLDNEEEIIEPLSELVSAHQPQLYKKFYISEFWQKLHESFKQGSSTIDAFRV